MPFTFSLLESVFKETMMAKSHTEEEIAGRLKGPGPLVVLVSS
jgi:hypothetical protein